MSNHCAATATAAATAAAAAAAAAAATLLEDLDTRFLITRENEARYSSITCVRSVTLARASEMRLFWREEEEERRPENRPTPLVSFSPRVFSWQFNLISNN